LVARWIENDQWQYFSGMEYYQTKFPCDPAQITRFRQMLGKAGVEELLNDQECQTRWNQIQKDLCHGRQITETQIAPRKQPFNLAASVIL
jgi:hypothetical protein